jgi:hypothetical protein
VFNALDADADGSLSVAAKHIGGPLLFRRIRERMASPPCLLKLRAFELRSSARFSSPGGLFVSESDRGCSSWMAEYDIPGVDGLDLHHFYRAMAWLGEELEEKPAGKLALRCVQDVIE